jgi:hypothetical protein
MNCRLQMSAWAVWLEILSWQASPETLPAKPIGEKLCKHGAAEGVELRIYDNAAVGI